MTLPRRCTSGARGQAALAAPVLIALAAPAAAQMSPNTYTAFEDILLRQHNDRSTWVARDGECTLSHRYTRRVAPGVFLDREAQIDLAVLDLARLRIERDGPNAPQIVVPLHGGSGPIEYALTLTDFVGDWHESFRSRYGGSCDASYCDASERRNEAYLNVVGPDADTDIDLAAAALAELAGSCQTVQEGG